MVHDQQGKSLLKELRICERMWGYSHFYFGIKPTPGFQNSSANTTVAAAVRVKPVCMDAYRSSSL